MQDVHKHFGGSVSADTLQKILYNHNFNVSKEEINNQILFGDKPRNFKNFLKLFELQNQIHWTYKDIDTCIEEVVKDGINQGVTQSLISMSISKYMNFIDDSPEAIMEHIINKFKDTDEKCGTTTKLLLSFKMESEKDRQAFISESLLNSNISKELYGIDLVGDANSFDRNFYYNLLYKWSIRCPIIRVHAGELPGSEWQMGQVLSLPINRIAHGIYVDPQVLELYVKKGIVFDLSISSNLCTGSVTDINLHPAQMHKEFGAKMTFSTDDPVQFECTLNDEYDKAKILFGSIEEYIEEARSIF